jgi:hypothetical protein
MNQQSGFEPIDASDYKPLPKQQVNFDLSGANFEELLQQAALLAQQVCTHHQITDWMQ